MLRAVAAILPLLIAAAILLAGNGLQGTLLAVRANIEGFPTSLIGVLMSAYFAGFVLGCRFNPAFIKSVGHIRTFLALASIASASGGLPLVTWTIRTHAELQLARDYKAAPIFEGLAASQLAALALSAGRPI